MNLSQIHPGNWPEMKRLYIEGMILACMLDYGSLHDPQWATIQALEAIRDAKEKYALSGMPFELYADLIVTMRDRVSQLPPRVRETAAKLQALAEELSRPVPK